LRDSAKSVEKLEKVNLIFELQADLYEGSHKIHEKYHRNKQTKEPKRFYVS
jgi:hypothetical protein